MVIGRKTSCKSGIKSILYFMSENPCEKVKTLIRVGIQCFLLWVAIELKDKEIFLIHMSKEIIYL